MSGRKSTQQNGGIGGFVEAARRVFAFSGSTKSRDALAASCQTVGLPESHVGSFPAEQTATTKMSRSVGRNLGAQTERVDQPTVAASIDSADRSLPGTSVARTDAATSSFVSRLLRRKPANSTRSGKRRVARGKQNHAVTVRKLAAAGLNCTEISRRTSLSQDLVVLLLNLGATPVPGQSAR